MSLTVQAYFTVILVSSMVSFHVSFCYEFKKHDVGSKTILTNTLTYEIRFTVSKRINFTHYFCVLLQYTSILLWLFIPFLKTMGGFLVIQYEAFDSLIEFNMSNNLIECINFSQTDLVEIKIFVTSALQNFYNLYDMRVAYTTHIKYKNN